MILSKFFRFVKKNIEKNEEDIILFVGVALISSLSFTVGYIISEANRDEPMQFETQAKTEIQNETDKPNIDGTLTSDKIQIDEQK